MSRYWSDTVHRLTPYVPGEQPQGEVLSKLNTNENPYPPSPQVIQAIEQALSDQGRQLALYPEPTGRVLRQAVAQHCGVSPEQVFVGNGSDEVLAHTFGGLLKHAGRPLLFPDVSYAFYKVYCGLYDITYRTVALNAQLQIDIDDYLQADAGAIIFANPNAPTGHALLRCEVARLLQACPDKMVVIDEAYIDFGGESAVGLVAQYPNLLVVQTLSKSRSLAGLRIGYAVGQAPLIEGLTRIKDSFNSYPLDRLALAAGVAALEDTAHFETIRQAVMRTREKFSLDLQALGFEVLPSCANFLFVQHPKHVGKDLAQRLREAGILVRRFDQPERIANFLRISIGTDAQCAQAVRVLANVVGQV